MNRDDPELAPVAAVALSAASLPDFGDVEDLEEADLELIRPGETAPCGIVIRLAGPTHPKRRAWLLARSRKLRAVMEKAGKVKLPDPVEDEAEDVELLVTCTLGWRGAATAYSPDAARALYSNHRTAWVRDAVKTALEERERFTSRSVRI